MVNLQKTFQKLDHLQQRHRFSAFTYAVIKRYSEDQAGYQAALLTYYAFLALFPLLLVLTTLTQLLATSQPHLQASIVTSVSKYFPVLGSQLSAHIHSLHQNGLALVVGLVFTLYGARGVADVFRSGVNHVWRISPDQQPGFPLALFKSFAVMATAGVGFMGVAFLAGLTATAGHGLAFKLLSFLANILLLFGLFVLLFKLSLPNRVIFRETRLASAAAAAGLTVLQLVGSYLLARELKKLDVLYSYFALSLGLIFWIYLQAQIIYFAAEIAVVKSHRLWPRSLRG